MEYKVEDILVLRKHPEVAVKIIEVNCDWIGIETGPALRLELLYLKGVSENNAYVLPVNSVDVDFRPRTDTDVLLYGNSK